MKKRYRVVALHVPHLPMDNWEWREVLQTDSLDEARSYCGDHNPDDIFRYGVTLFTPGKTYYHIERRRLLFWWAPQLGRALDKIAYTILGA